jgi:hypothetical protein
MVKKVILGTLAVALVAILVAGAVNRTNSKVLAANSEGGGRHGQAEVALAEPQALGRGATEGQGGGGKGWGRQGEAAETDVLPSESEARGGWGSSGEAAGVGQTVVTEWVTLTGIVLTADEAALVVAADGGEDVEISPRGWAYAQSQGFAPAVGDAVTLTGFYEEDRFEASVIADATNGQTVRLRDENGRPMWAGRGRGRGQS